MSGLPRMVKYEDIMRGKVFNVAIPHTEGRPFDFIIENETNKGTYNIVTKDDGFEGVIDPVTGRRKAPTVMIATEFKLRPAVVISSNVANQKANYHSVIVLPIASIFEKDKSDSLVQRMMSSNDIGGLHYIGQVTGRDAYITVNDPKRLHKNMLFEPAKEVLLDEELMAVIMEKLAGCLEIKQIPQCKECEKNCDKCQYKVAVNK